MPVAHTPNGMKLLIHILFPRPPLNEPMNESHLLIIASFKPTGIMKDKTRVAFKYHLILDVVPSTLQYEDINLIEHDPTQEPLTSKDASRADDLI